MSNEFVARNGVIALASSQVTGSLNVSGGITGSLLGSASFATTSSFAISSSYAQTASLALAVTGGFAKSFAIINNAGIAATDIGTFQAWRANTPCTASMVLGYRDLGTAAAVNAVKNGSSDLLASDLSLATSDTWISSSVLQNQNFNVGDTLAFKLTSFTGTIDEVAIQVSFTY